MSNLFDNLIRVNWRSIEEMERDIEAADFDIINKDDYKMSVVDNFKSDGIVEVFNISWDSDSNGKYVTIDKSYEEKI